MSKNWLLVIIWLLYLGHWSFGDSVFIEGVEMKRDRGYDYLDIYITGWSAARGLLLENKLYLDFPNTKIGKKARISRKRSNRIQNIQLAQKDAKTARVVVSLKKEIDYDIVNVFGGNKSVVEICDRLENIYTHQLAWEARSAKRKAATLKPVRLSPVISEKPLPLRGKKIIIDPGHGGDDPGAFSVSGYTEKAVTLQTAQKTAQLLRRAGATVHLTRNEDRRANLKDIAEFANRIRADIFISIHYNSIHDSKISGTETYFYNTISRKFAEKMHETIIRGIRRKDRGLHRTPFYVVKNTEMPSVLIEPVYLTNHEESDLAKSSPFQEELAQDIAKGVGEYFRSRAR